MTISINIVPMLEVATLCYSLTPAQVPNTQLIRPSKGGWLIPQCTWGSGMSPCYINTYIFNRNFFADRCFSTDHDYAHKLLSRSFSGAIFLLDHGIYAAFFFQLISIIKNRKHKCFLPPNYTHNL